MEVRVIPIRLDAPRKPELGATCNGCGVCCLAAPCPVSALVLQHRTGACPALVWHDDGKLYRCGMLEAPSQHSRWIAAWLDPLMIVLVKRWLALDIGCDAALEFDEASEDQVDTHVITK